MILYLTVNSEVTIPELGNRVLDTSLINYAFASTDGTLEFDVDRIRTASSLQTAINNGDIVLTDDEGNIITDIGSIQTTVFSIDANNVEFVPSDVVNWLLSPGPNTVNLALDELASRVKYLEVNGGGGGISLTDLSATSPLTYSNLTGVFGINQSTGSTNGYLSSADWTTFNNKQNAISLTVNGSSGSATFNGSILNIPTYTLAGLGGQQSLRGTGIVVSTGGTISYITDNSTNWDTAFSERRQWDGGSTNLVAETGRTSLGASIVGSNLFTATDPSAITFIRINADNSVSLLDAASFRTAIGASIVGSNLFTATDPSAITFIRINADNSVSLLDAASFRTAIGAGTGNGTVTTVSIVSNQGVSGSVANATTTPEITLSLGELTGITSINGLIITANTGVITTGTWSASTIAANRGGTGFSEYTVGDLLYADTTSTLAKLLGVATGNVLLSGGVSAAPSWGKVDLTTHITGNLPVTNLNSGTSASASTFWRGDGVWAAPAEIVGISFPLTTKGDIFTYDTAGARLPVGSNEMLLISDSNETTGLKWVDGSIRAYTNTGTGNTVVNTLTEINFTTNGTSYSIPANSVKQYSSIRFSGYGQFSTKGGSVGTLTIRLKIGSTTINTTVASLGSSVVAQGFKIEGNIHCRAAGSGGTIFSHMIVYFDGASSSGTPVYASTSNGTISFNTTIANTLLTSAQWSVANAANSVTLENIVVEHINRT